MGKKASDMLLVDLDKNKLAKSPSALADFQQAYRQWVDEGGGPCPDAPVARLVGVGQGATAHFATQSHVIELGGLRAQTRLDVAKAFAVGQLCERHA